MDLPQFVSAIKKTRDVLACCTTLSTRDHDAHSALIVNTVSLTIFLITTYVISQAGQRVQNSSAKLKRKICALYVQNLENDEHCQLTKDLLRYCYNHPVCMHVMGSLNADMSMLPSFVAFVMSNTIIALQFNNVL